VRAYSPTRAGSSFILDLANGCWVPASPPQKLTPKKKGVKVNARAGQEGRVFMTEEEKIFTVIQWPIWGGLVGEQYNRVVVQASLHLTNGASKRMMGMPAQARFVRGFSRLPEEEGAGGRRGGGLARRGGSLRSMVLGWWVLNPPRFKEFFVPSGGRE